MATATRARVALLAAAALAMVGGASAARKFLPVVLLHGVTGSKKRMDLPVQWIQEALGADNVYVKNVEVGDGPLDSMIWGMNRQVDAFAESVLSDPELADGFNLIGYSQGGLNTRAFVERYGAHAKVHNFITWSGPHGGVYGIPGEIKLPKLVKFFDELMDSGLSAEIQDHVSFAGYWRDPYNVTDYVRNSVFLGDINNVRPEKNGTYKANMVALNSFTALYSTVDTTVIPRESGIFGIFADGSNTESEVVPLQKQPLYTEDWIGLRTLDERGDLALRATNCKHHDYVEPVCKHWFTEFTLPRLNVTVEEARESRLARGLA